MAMFSTSVATIGDCARIASRPSQLVFTKGKSSVLSLNCNTAPADTWKLTLLFSVRGPVSQNPAGTSTVPPPAFAQASMACVIAFVFNVMPSARAPNRLIENVSVLKETCAITGSCWANVVIDISKSQPSVCSFFIQRVTDDKFAAVLFMLLIGD